MVEKAGLPGGSKPAEAGRSVFGESLPTYFIVPGVPRSYGAKLGCECCLNLVPGEAFKKIAVRLALR